MSDSTVYTIGTALNRAKDAGATVSVLVAGQWEVGMVVAVDGHGVILDGGSAHLVIRMEAVAAVRIRSESPDQQQRAVQA